MTWLVPLLVAAAVGVVATPLARRLALSSGFVDQPASHKSHGQATPYLGGVAIAVAMLSGMLAGHPSGVAVLVACLGIVLVLTGLVDDHRSLSAGSRLLVEVVCAVGVVMLGIRVRGTGVGGLDIAVSLLLLVGLPNAVNLLDNLDGLAAGVTGAGAGGLVVLGVLDGHTATLTTSAALLGACLAFLIFNAPPASIFMGDAGSLLLGFILATQAIIAGSALPEPASLAIPLLVLGLPMADTSTVFLARLRNGRSPFAGGRDHLSHRLAQAGLGSTKAVALLVGIEGVMSALAVLAARRIIPLPAAVGCGVLVLTALVATACRKRIYLDEAEPLPGRPHKSDASTSVLGVHSREVLGGLPSSPRTGSTQVGAAAGYLTTISESDQDPASENPGRTPGDLTSSGRRLTR
ncbi:MAG: glycosyltransferase family 4 protein [Acidimicrobiales bacterium]